MNAYEIIIGIALIIGLLILFLRAMAEELERRYQKIIEDELKKLDNYPELMKKYDESIEIGGRILESQANKLKILDKIESRQDDLINNAKDLINDSNDVLKKRKNIWEREN